MCFRFMIRFYDQFYDHTNLKQCLQFYLLPDFVACFLKNLGQNALYSYHEKSEQIMRLGCKKIIFPHLRKISHFLHENPQASGKISSLTAFLSVN